MMTEWFVNRVLDLAYYCPIPFFAYMLISFAINLMHDGPPLRCVKIKKWMEWELEVSSTYVEETEQLVDGMEKKCQKT